LVAVLGWASDADAIVVMDADATHDVTLIATLDEQIEGGYCTYRVSLLRHCQPVLAEAPLVLHDEFSRSKSKLKRWRPRAQDLKLEPCVAGSRAPFREYP
jgi:hypothetical protein